jgi:hypothetical protein
MQYFSFNMLSMGQINIKEGSSDHHAIKNADRKILLKTALLTLWSRTPEHILLG